MKIELKEALREIEGNKFFKTIEKGNLVKVSYRFNSPKVFTTPLKRELRGITFLKDSGKVASRPYHKFFNLNETQESSEENFKGRELLFREKLDGVMLHPVLVGKEVKLLTQKDFSNPQTQKGEELLKKREKLYSFVKELLEKGYTPILELISPEFQVVVPQEEEELYITEIRENETGEYLLEKVEGELKERGIKVPKKRVSTIEKVKEELSQRENFEGYVLKDFKRREPFPTFVKVKSPWYHRAHYAFTYLHNVPPHKLFNLYLTGKSDELFSQITNEKLKEKREEELKRMVELHLTLLDLVKRGKNPQEIIKEIKKSFSREFKELEVNPEYLKEALRLLKKGKAYDKYLGTKLYILIKEGKVLPKVREGE
ncbi:RNA ligase [Thermovibrio sp.]